MISENLFPPFILASGSPRRLKILQEAGFDFKVVVSEVAEEHNGLAEPQGTAMALATLKAREVGSRYPNVWIVGADTIVVLDNQILGKPLNRELAYQTLQKLNNRTHEVITAVCLFHQQLEREHCFAESSKVAFKNNSLATLAAYADSPEPLDKAGAYAVQGAGRELIDHIEGDLDNIIGFPLNRFLTVLAQLR